VKEGRSVRKDIARIMTAMNAKPRQAISRIV
jgi:ribosomal protein L29